MIENDFNVPTMELALSMIKNYAIDHKLTPSELLVVLHEGMITVGETYPENNSIYIGVMLGSKKVNN